jgi:hypothetical protein
MNVVHIAFRPKSVPEKFLKPDTCSSRSVLSEDPTERVRDLA